MCLTAEDDYSTEQEDSTIYWLNEDDHYECHENLGTIIPLGTEECIVDTNNHIQNLNGFHLFFEELGVLTEEPEPIDPNRDYEGEARLFFSKQRKCRRENTLIQEGSIPSLLEEEYTHSTTSSAASSYHTTTTTIHMPSSKSTSIHYTYNSFI